MKRGTEEAAIDVGNCLMLLSKVGQETENEITKDSTTGRLFVCKTCNRKFSSFQALGGHCASHKKPKLNGNDDHNLLKLSSSSHPKPKTHNCSICGLEFAIGQALGGHMRRHRGGDGLVSRALLPVPAVMKKCNSSKRVLCLDLDLNLTPMENYDLTLQLGKVVF